MPKHPGKTTPRKRLKAGKNTESQLNRVEGFNRVVRDAKGRIPPKKGKRK